MSGLGLLFLQLAAGGATAAAPLPDIEIKAHVTAREVRIRQQGTARLTLHADPGVAPPVRVERSAPAGQQRYRNLSIDLTAQAHLTHPDPSSQQGNMNASDQP
jgi:hypothetical protein